MNIKVEALGAFKMLEDPLIVKGIQEIVSAYHVRNGKKWNDGSKGEIRMSPGELMDLLAFFATPVDVPEPNVVQQKGETNDDQENGSNFVPGP